MRKQRRSQQVVAGLAARQYGVVSSRQLRGLGFSDFKTHREAQAGRLHKLHRGIYAVGHPAVSRHGEAMAALLAVGEEGLLSHRSAAWLWGLTKRWQLPIEVTAATPRRALPAIRIHSATALSAEDRSVFEAIPVTAVPRTLLDFAASDPAFLGRALDNAERRGLLDLLAIDELLARSAGFRGVRRLRGAVEPFRIPAFTRSGVERRFLALVRSAGLPTPSMNFFVGKYELDAYWPAERFAVELDTYEYHGGHTAFEEDRLRQETLKLEGIEMVRLTGRRLKREPSAVAARLTRLLTQRRTELGRTHGP